MTDVVLIGNSHTAAVRQAQRFAEDKLDGLRIRYFVAPQMNHAAYSLRNGRWFGPDDPDSLTPDFIAKLKAMNGATEIDIGSADFVVALGFNTSATTLLWFLARNDVDGLRDTGADTRISRAAFEAMLEDIVLRNLPEDSSWFAPEGAKVIHVAAPRPTETIVRQSQFAPLEEDDSGLAEALEMLDAAWLRAMKARGIRYVPQPRLSIAANGLTAFPFSVQAHDTERLVNVAEDFKHMNPEYGRLVWNEILAELHA